MQQIVKILNTEILNAERVVGSGRLSPRFQKKFWDARQCVPEKAAYVVVNVKSNMLWRPQKVEKDCDMNHFKKFVRNEQN